MVGIIDVGNTQIKCAVFDNQTLVATVVFATKGGQHPHIFFDQYNLQKIFVSTVVDLSNNVTAQLKAPVVLFSSSSKLPLVNAYKTPQTLGLDRLANACGAFIQNNRQGPVLVIDMGTCIKYDFVDEEKKYCGGSISPGLTMRYNALHQFTNKLPLLNPKEKASLLGTNTEESIQSGVQNGILAEVEGIIDTYKQEYATIKVFLTGGDSAFFSGSLKNNIFAVPLLTLYGLNAIAQLNDPEE